jgi:hypothetical protein
MGQGIAIGDAAQEHDDFREHQFGNASGIGERGIAEQIWDRG